MAPKRTRRPATTRSWGGESVGASRLDWREQLVNRGDCGPVTQVSLAEATITSLHGILLDFDPGRLHPDLAPGEVLRTPQKLWSEIVKSWTDRHPVFAAAEVRSSGTGLHAIVRLSPLVAFLTEADREKWANVVKVVQTLLPTDPDCPGITAMTRPVGSVNTKNGARVELLREGRPAAPEEVLALCAQAAARPFATVAGLLFAEGRVSPCPVCRVRGSRLDVMDHAGTCYGGCGKVGIGQLFDAHLKPRAASKGGR
ncbi:unnamed protein product [Gemmataceae bacterium]|nr:unnamed protein product [Gemmataceae bacterium]VTU00923.1 unnamed protein product [Gemmataceae bacterium]